VIVAGSWTLRNETPASHPRSSTVSPRPRSQNPRPYRIDSFGTSLRGRVISTTNSFDTIRPSNNAFQNNEMSSVVV
jgi:hypothetical protein